MRARHLLAPGLLALLAGACECTAPPPPPVRGVVLVVVDTLRADALGPWGQELPTSPFLDRFAAERGVVFERARATSPWTKPSVASILTGLDPRHHQVTLHVEKLHSELPRLPQAFRAAGWQTAGVQSNFLLKSSFGYADGFDTYVETLEGDGRVIASHDRSTGEAVNAAALRWLREERDPARPFFLYVHHYEPHFVYLRDGAAFATGETPYDGPLTGAESMDELVAATPLLSRADAEFLRARYLAEVRYQDELLERLVAGIDELGLGTDTAILITADHGEEFLEHGELSHQYKLYDELLRVPLVLARPGERHPGARVTANVSIADVGRTLLDLAGLDRAAFPGRSLLPLLEAPPPKGAGRPVMAHAETIPNVPEGERAVPVVREAIVRGNWKLIRNVTDGTRSLFDLKEDPGETRDLWTPESPDARRLEQELDAWLEAGRELERAREPEAIEFSEEELGYLRDLGYLGN